VFGPAGGFNSCLHDMSHWVRMQLNNGEFEGERLISEKNLEITRTPQTIVSAEFFYCMGWIFHQRGNHRVIWHNGGTPGHTTWVGLQPEHKLGLIVLSNLGDTQMPDAASFKFFSLVHNSDEIDYSTMMKQNRSAAEVNPRAVQQEETLSSPPASRLTGRYDTPALGEIKVDAKGNELTIRFVKPALEARLVHRDGAAFGIQFTDGWLAEIGWTEFGNVRFLQSEQGEFDGLQIHLGEKGDGATFRAVRQKDDERTGF
ncbi:MAG TPA: serine hydrolase, partial [Planctomycetaceae bacterium]|nr:serine hydrolase [Planctomycetaceae bacterium]